MDQITKHSTKNSILYASTYWNREEKTKVDLKNDQVHEEDAEMTVQSKPREDLKSIMVNRFGKMPIITNYC